MDRIESRVKKARVRLYRNAPFFGHLVNHLTFIKSEKVPTAAVDYKGNMYYNPDFIRGLSTAQTQGLIAHEVMHVAMLGHERQGSRDDKLWNIAQDIVINHLLVKAGMELPESDLIPEDGELSLQNVVFDDLNSESFETVYGAIAPELDDVPDDLGFDGHIIDDGDGNGIGSSNGGDGEEDETDKQNQNIASTEEKDWEDIVRRAKTIAEQDSSNNRGYEPGEALEVVHADEPGTVDYRRYIKQKMSGAIPSDYTYQRPNKRGRVNNVYLPSISRKNEKITVSILLDTSGSISTNNLERFTAEIVKLVETFDQVELTIIQHDADVQKVDEYVNPRSVDVDTIEVAGRGGTDHHTPIDELIERDTGPDLIIAYTDAESSIPETIPFSVPFIWVLNLESSKKAEDLPFGVVSRIE